MSSSDLPKLWKEPKKIGGGTKVVFQEWYFDIY